MPIVIFLLVVIILILCPNLIGGAAIAVASVLYLLSKLIIPIAIFIALLIIVAILEKGGKKLGKKIKVTILCIEIGFIIFLWSLIHYTGAYLFSDIFFIMGMSSLMMFESSEVKSELNFRQKTTIITLFIGYIFISFYEISGMFLEGIGNEPSIITLLLFGTPIFVVPFAFLISDFFKWLFNSKEKHLLTVGNFKYLKSIGLIKIILCIFAIIFLAISAYLIKQQMIHFILT